MRKNKILFALNHPAHVHLFKNLIVELISRGLDVEIFTRDKDITVHLLEYYKLKFELIKIPSLPFRNIVELLKRDLFFFFKTLKNKYTMCIGTDVSMTHIFKRTYFFGEDDDDTVKLGVWITYPFAYKIINPQSIVHKRWKRKRIFHNSYHELAYLHPNNFKPDENVLIKYKLKKKNYIIVRFSALNAWHDTNAKGISNELWLKIESILNDYHIIKSVENSKNKTINPWEMHHVMYYAKMIISDSQTMTIEGAVLGVPSIRINTFMGKSSVIEELEKKYQLAFGFYPDQHNEVISTINQLVNDLHTEDVWEERRKKMLSEKYDFNMWMINFFNNELS